MGVVITGAISITGNVTIGDVPLPNTFIVTQGTPNQIVTEVASGSDAIIQENN